MLNCTENTDNDYAKSRLIMILLILMKKWK